MSAIIVVRSEKSWRVDERTLQGQDVESAFYTSLARVRNYYTWDSRE